MTKYFLCKFFSYSWGWIPFSRLTIQQQICFSAFLRWLPWLLPHIRHWLQFWNFLHFRLGPWAFSVWYPEGVKWIRWASRLSTKPFRRTWHTRNSWWLQPCSKPHHLKQTLTDSPFVLFLKSQKDLLPIGNHCNHQFFPAPEFLESSKRFLKTIWNLTWIFKSVRYCKDTFRPKRQPLPGQLLNFSSTTATSY